MKIEIKHVGISCLYRIFSLLPIKKNKVVFSNYVGKGYGCNPKYIAEEIIKRHPDWDLVWMTKNTSDAFPPEIRPVKYESVRNIYELATAGIWIDNQRKLPYHKKREQQFFLETWHGGGIPMKKIGADNPANFDNEPYHQTSLHMNRITNLMISNSKACTEIFHRAFLYDGEILECGYPRNDILVRNSNSFHDLICKHYELPVMEKLALYAPTYRKGRKLDQYLLDTSQISKALSTHFGGNWTILLRLHPTMQEKANEYHYDKTCINATCYNDTQELLAGCDVLISDYSSVISEFALTHKPVFLYANDIKDYAVERDFYTDYYSLPFPIAESNEQLIKNIINYNIDYYQDKLSKFFTDIGMTESGTAASQVVDRLEAWILK